MVIVGLIVFTIANIADALINGVHTIYGLMALILNGVAIYSAITKGLKW